jgi:hypothetical protein
MAMGRGNELICAHSALAFAVLLGIGAFLIAGWLPPIPPALDADAIATLFAENRTRIRIGTSILALGSVFWWTFSVAIWAQMKRIEGNVYPLATVQVISSTGTALVVMLASYLWLAAAYRAGIPAANIQLYNDLAWIMFIGAYPPIVLQNVAIGLCILRAPVSSAAPYPRWAGYVSLWCAILYLPGALVPFFQHGPFAWNGLLSFWLVATALFIWILVFWYLTVKAIKRQPA